MLYFDDHDHRGKFDAKSDEGIFLGYAINSKAYRVYNKKNFVVQESMHVVFYESNHFIPIVHSDEDVKINQKDIQIQIYDTFKDDLINAQTPVKELENQSEQVSNELPKSWKFVSNHPIDQILGEPI